MVTRFRGLAPLALLAAAAFAPQPLAESRASAPASNGDARFRALQRQLVSLARQAPASGVAYWVEDRENGRKWSFNADQVFRSASLIKIPIAALAYAQWEANPGRRNPAIERRVWRIIAESHNPSTDVVVDHVGGLGRVNAFCRDQGWTATRMNHKLMHWRTRKAHNLTSARDVAAMLRAIDDRKLISRAASESLWKALCDQKIVKRIPAALPRSGGLKVGNKTGTMLSVLHDAGIVRGPGVHYVLVVMTARPRSEAAGDAFCRKVSGVVYQALKP